MNTWLAPIDDFSLALMDSRVELLSLESRRWSERLDEAVVAGKVQRLEVYLEFRDSPDDAVPTRYWAGSLELVPGSDWWRALMELACRGHWPDTFCVLVPKHAGTAGVVAPGAHRLPVAVSRWLANIVENPAAPAELSATAFVAFVNRQGALAAAQVAVRAAAARPVDDRRDDGPSSHQLRARNTALPRNGHAVASGPSLARSDGGADGDGPPGDADGNLAFHRLRPLLERAASCLAERFLTLAFRFGHLLRLLYFAARRHDRRRLACFTSAGRSHILQELVRLRFWYRRERGPWRPRRRSP